MKEQTKWEQLAQEAVRIFSTKPKDEEQEETQIPISERW